MTNTSTSSADIDVKFLEARQAFENGNYKLACDSFYLLNKEYSLKAFDAEIAISSARLHREKPPFFVILDEMSQASWQNVLTLHPLTPQSGSKMLTCGNYPLFIESAWEGLNKCWQYAMPEACHFRPIARQLRALLLQARYQGKQIIFWNKEDPLHFDDFIRVARMADIILTTDSNSIDRYRKAAPSARVGCLRFAANINLCNPANRDYKTPGTICFAGSNYISNHNDRIIQLKMLLPLIEHFSGTIYDRNQGLSNLNRFPRRYLPFIKAAIPFAKMVYEYRKFRFFLNVNTITDSPTMLARRVYELLACGTPVISWPSKALETQFDGIVQVATTPMRAIQIVEDYLNDEDKWKRLSHLGYREVMTRHTYKHRLEEFGNFIKLDVPKSSAKVSIALATMRPHCIDRIVENIAGQNYDNLEVLVTTQGFTPANREELARKLTLARPGLQLRMLSDDSRSSLGERINRMWRLAKGEYIAKFDDDDFYFPNYLADAILPFSYTDAGIVGKRETYFWLDGPDETHKLGANRCHCYTDRVTGATMIWKSHLRDSFGFGQHTFGEDTDFLANANNKGVKIYSSDPFNYTVYRTFKNNAHTFNLDIEYFRRKTLFIGMGFRKDIIVI